MTLWLLAGAYLLLINLFTAALWGHDKACAVAKTQRVSEATLLTLCFIGGWPGGLLAAHAFRHKTRKTAFIAKLTAVVAVEIVLVCALTIWL